ncbi:sugar kinase [[Actinomadura] parvosata]|nr:sugar kinase [Nonomuraea sp. ATCC 55076]
MTGRTPGREPCAARKADAGAGRVDVVGVGEAMVLLEADDLVGAERFGVSVAGAELNVCTAVARLGLRAAFASRVGTDPFGMRVLRDAAGRGMDTGLVITDPGRPTGVFFKEIRPDGGRRVHYYRTGSAASAMDVPDAAPILARRPRAIVVSGLTAALGPGPARLVAALCEGAGDALVVLDPNLRPALPVDALAPLLPRVGLLVLGQDESRVLFGESDPARVFAAARAAGVGEVVLKGGPEGAWYAGDSGPEHVPSAAREVRDPVGAGDAFLGGYLAARLSGAAPGAATRLGAELAGRVIATPGDTSGLPAPDVARALLRDALAEEGAARR